MNLETLSDADIEALDKGNFDGLSDHALKTIDSHPVSQLSDAAQSLDSGLVNGIPNAIDTLGALGASGVEKATNYLKPGTFSDTSVAGNMQRGGLGTFVNSLMGTKPYQSQTPLGQNLNAAGQGASSALLAPGASLLGTAMGGAAGGVGSYQANQFMQANPSAPAAIKLGLPLAAGLLGNFGGGAIGNTLDDAATGLLGLKSAGGLPVAPTPQDSMMNVAGILRGNAATANQGVNDAYEAAKASGATIPASSLQTGLIPGLETATKPYTLASGGSELGLLRSARNMAEQGDDIPVNDMFTLRRAANQGIGEPSTILSGANRDFKSTLDSFFNNVTPNQGVDAWNAANAARSQYGQTFEQGLNGERGALDQVITQPNMTGADMLQKVLGNKQAASNAADFIKAGGSQADQVQTGLRQAMLQKLWNDSLANGSDSISPDKWNNSVKSLVKGNPELVNQLLTPDEADALASSGQKGLATRLAQKATGLMGTIGAIAGGVVGHHTGMGAAEGVMAGFGLPTLGREVLNHALTGNISNVYNGLLRSPYGGYSAGPSALVRGGLLGARSALGAASTYGGLLR